MTGAGWCTGLLLWCVLSSTTGVHSSRSHAATPARALTTAVSGASLPASPFDQPCSTPAPSRRQGAGQQQHQAAHRADAHPALGARIRQQRAGARLRVWVRRVGGCLALSCRDERPSRSGVVWRLLFAHFVSTAACCPALYSAQLAANRAANPRRTWCTCWRSTSGWPRSSPVSAAARLQNLAPLLPYLQPQAAALGSVCCSRPAGWPQALLPCQCRHPPRPSRQP